MRLWFVGLCGAEKICARCLICSALFGLGRAVHGDVLMKRFLPSHEASIWVTQTDRKGTNRLGEQKMKKDS